MAAIVLALLKSLLGVAFDQAINAAITMGIPWLLDWIDKNPKTPGWVKWAINYFNVSKILIDLVGELKKIQVSDLPMDEKSVAKREAKKEARKIAREKGPRIGFKSETKGLD